jgi:hypothetical protein
MKQFISFMMMFAIIFGASAMGSLDKYETKTKVETIKVFDVDDVGWVGSFSVVDEVKTDYAVKQYHWVGSYYWVGLFSVLTDFNHKYKWFNTNILKLINRLYQTEYKSNKATNNKPISIRMCNKWERKNE